jgi:type I restriction enzyme S subunit
VKVAATRAEQLHEGGRRLDASYHASEGVKALRFIRQWAGQPAQVAVPASRVLRDSAMAYSDRRLDALKEVCMPEGIFIPGRFKRIYVDDPDHGEPWLSPSNMLKADLSDLRLISCKYTLSIESLRVHQGWLLLSRSGTVGNLAYVREDMDGLVGSDDIIRIVADPEKIPPGYLYAFLSSPLGKALIEQKTYGAVVPHIEAHHVTDLPIPRVGPSPEEHIHELIEQAAALRMRAHKELDYLVQWLNEDVLGVPKGYRTRWPNEWSYDVKVVGRDNDLRLDPFYYVGHAVEYRQNLKPGPRLGDIATIHLSGHFKRMYVGPQGIPYLSGVDIYQLKVEPRLWLSRRQPELPELLVSGAGTILVQADGQRYGLLGRPAYADESIVGAAVSNHLVRIRAHSQDVAGYIYLFLSTEAGRRELIRHSYGTSIPTIPVQAFENLCISQTNDQQAKRMGQQAIEALQKRTQANRLEEQAQTLLFDALGLSSVVTQEVGSELNV